MSLWPAALGTNLWLLTLGVPLWLGPRPALPVLLLAPLPLLLLLLLLRPEHRAARPALLLGVPLLSFLPVADGPLADAALHPRPAVALQAAVLLGYLWTASRVLAAPGLLRRSGPKAASLAAAPAAPSLTPLKDQTLPERWRRRIQVYHLLTLASAAAPLLLLYALHWHPPTLRALRLSFGPPHRVSAVQASFTAAAALLWAVSFHFFLAGPLRAHLLQDRQTQAELQELRRGARRGRPRPHFYVAMLLALVSMALLIHRSLLP